ncbi:MAG: hypothetical protein IIW23_03380 [Clostridia bacterium]|nr:hypothetical protein [Clostridia bacterium]
METRISRNYYLRTSDFDKFRRIKPSAVMDLFQDAAGLHANLLGCGFEDMIDNKLIWVLTRVKFTIEKWPEMFSEVRVHTWPLEPSRAGFRREYLIETAAGEPLIKGSSEWVIIHSEERKIVSAKDIYPIKEGFCTELMHPDRLQKIKDFESAEFAAEITPEYCDIDMNAHVNNIKYLDYVMNAINPENSLEFASVQIDFRKEVLPEDRLKIALSENEAEIMAKGTDEAGNTMFMVKIEK